MFNLQDTVQHQEGEKTQKNTRERKKNKLQISSIFIRILQLMSNQNRVSQWKTEYIHHEQIARTLVWNGRWGRGGDFDTHIGVELPDEAGEVVVLEVVGEHVAREGGGVPDDEAVAGVAPGDDPVQLRLAHQVVRLGQERRQRRPLQQRLQRPRRLHQLVQRRDERGRLQRRAAAVVVVPLQLGLQQQRRRGVHHGGRRRVGVVVHCGGGGGGGAEFIGFGFETDILCEGDGRPAWRGARDLLFGR